MIPHENPQKTVALRPPEQVMQLSRMGSFHQSRLSFMRTLLRKLKREDWQFTRPVFDIDAHGVGTAVYTAQGPDCAYSLICFGHDLPADQRSDRVIAQAWDSTFALFKGVPQRADIERLRANVPFQEAGRVTAKEVTLSRANRSVRLFAHVLERLSEGQQPDAHVIAEVGYLMRTTAVYGSGKFGAADHAPGALPFQAEMLTVFLIRAYTLDLVEHMAQLRDPHRAVALDPNLRRMFGVGNSTGLGMAPFIVNHPVLLNNWIAARETALARVRSVPQASASVRSQFAALVTRARWTLETWRTGHPVQRVKNAALNADLAALSEHVGQGALNAMYPWDHLYCWAETHLSEDGQEQLVSLMLEPYGDLVDELTDTMGADEGAAFPIDGTMRVAQMKALLEKVFAKALATDWLAPEAIARVWYVSENKLEPRLGERFEEPLEPYEQALAPARDAAAMYADLECWESEHSEPECQATDHAIADFLLRHPQHRHTARRMQIAAKHPYSEVRDNTIAADMLPIDLLRCKLSFFGACHFDPRSDRWVRITMFQNAPFPDELTTVPDDWAYPTAGEAPACIP